MENKRDEFIQKDDMIKNIYKLANEIYDNISYREDVSEYYRCILQAIYIRTGNKEMHTFTGIVTNVDNGRRNKTIYISNIFWNTVYVTHHVVIKAKSNDKHLTDLSSGDYISFTCNIDEYSDGSNFGLCKIDNVIKLSNRRPIKIYRLGNAKDTVPLNDSLKSIINKYGRNLTLVFQSWNKIHDIDYEDKHRLFKRLLHWSIYFNYHNKRVPANYYNSMILSLYYRQQREDILYNRIIELIPENDDLTELIMIQLFVRWLTEHKGITNPADVFFNTVKFIIDMTTYRLSEICRKNNISYISMIGVQNNIFTRFVNLNDKYLYKEGHLQEFDKYIKDNLSNFIEIKS